MISICSAFLFDRRSLGVIMLGFGIDDDKDDDEEGGGGFDEHE